MEELHSVHDVARMLKLSESTIYRYVESGAFPCLRIGPGIRFTEEHIKLFFTGKTRQTRINDGAITAQKIKTLYDQMY